MVREAFLNFRMAVEEMVRDRHSAELPHHPQSVHLALVLDDRAISHPVDDV
jgi:hypothetical protein